MSRGPVRRRSSTGQASVELVLVLPLLTVLLLALVQVGLVARDAVLVVHAAREAARAAAVDPRSGTARKAAVGASGLDPGRLGVALGPGGGRLQVSLRYRSPTNVPLIGTLVPDVDLHASVTIRLEAANRSALRGFLDTEREIQQEPRH